ncbi:MAG TPA: SLC13 family permease [Geobacteraceae bacterium]
MSIEMVVVLAVIAGAGVLFLTETLSIDLVALVIMATLILCRVITPDEGIAGFSNRATVTIGALFVLSAGLFKTGAANFAGLFLARLGKRNFWFTLIAMMVSIGFLSAFMNHTAVVAIFIPIVLDIARDIKVSPSKLLMPLSFSSMFGGACTLVGSSTYILVNSIAEQNGEPPFGMFEFAWLGLILFGVGIVYMFLFGIRMIPERGGNRRKTLVKGHYLTELIVQPQARFLGKRLFESPLVRDLDIESLEIYRGESRLCPPLFAVVLKEGDLLRVRCDVEKIRKLQELKGITLKSMLACAVEGKHEENFLVEAVVAPDSMLVGKSLREVRFRSSFGAVVHAIRHRGETMTDNVETTSLYPGDTLLIEADHEILDRLRDHDAFVVVSEVELPTFRKRKMLVALAIVAGVIVSSATGLMPLVASSVIGAVLIVMTRCLTLHEAYSAIDWKVIFLLAGVLTLGTALEKTGVALLVAKMLIASVGMWGPTALVSAFYLLTSLFTEIVSNKAAAGLLAPIAIVAAHSVGGDPRPFLMAVAFAGSVTFMTPVGHQVNTMVYGPGRFRFTDFVRVGAPLNFMFWVLSTLLIPRFWPF